MTDHFENGIIFTFYEISIRIPLIIMNIFINENFSDIYYYLY